MFSPNTACWADLLTGKGAPYPRIVTKTQITQFMIVMSCYCQSHQTQTDTWESRYHTFSRHHHISQSARASKTDRQGAPPLLWCDGAMFCICDEESILWYESTVAEANRGYLINKDAMVDGFILPYNRPALESRPPAHCNFGGDINMQSLAWVTDLLQSCRDSDTATTESDFTVTVHFTKFRDVR